MKALRFEAWKQAPVLREIPIPEPGPGEVLIKVGGSGACHSDMHIMEAPAGKSEWKLPFTLGHETAGVRLMMPDSLAYEGGSVLIPGRIA